jgi:hypothetical protein
MKQYTFLQNKKAPLSCPGTPSKKTFTIFEDDHLLKLRL